MFQGFLSFTQMRQTQSTNTNQANRVEYENAICIQSLDLYISAMKKGGESRNSMRLLTQIFILSKENRTKI